MRSFKIIGLTLCLTSGLNTLAKGSLKFSHEKSGGQKITISAVGDILLHETLQRRAVKENSFAPLWQNVTPFFEASHYSYGNLESPAAKGIDKNGNRVKDPGFVYDGKVYSSYPKFNYHPSIIRDLKKSGLDILSTANNHSLDRYGVGVDETVKAIESEDMLLVGTRLKEKQKKNNLQDWYKITDIEGVKVAWIACTFIMNYPMTDDYDQVMYCHSQKGMERINKIIDEQKNKVDAIFITPHWGDEYKYEPNSKQKDFARAWIERGATAIIGSHPHVLQPAEVIKAKDGREGFVIYSLGNFVSNQGGSLNECHDQACFDKKLAQRSSVVMFIDLVKGKKGTNISKVRFLPTRVVGQNRVNDIELQVLSKDYLEFDEELAEREDLSSPKTYGEGRRELNHIRNIFGEENLIFELEEI